MRILRWSGAFAERHAHWLALAVCLLFVGVQLIPRRLGADGMDYAAFGRLPALHQGRVQPLDSVARNALAIISGRQAFKLEGKSAPAIRWLAELMLRPDEAERLSVFRIDHPELKSLVGQAQSRESLFSFADLQPHLQEIDEQSREAHRLAAAPGQKPSLFQQHLMQLRERLELYLRIDGRSHDLVHLVPPLAQGEEWRTLAQMMQLRLQSPALSAWGDIFNAYATGDATAWNAAVASYAAMLEVRAPDESGRAGLEAAFNHVDPFTCCMVLYVTAFVLACLSWLGWSKPLLRAAFVVLAVALAVQTGGLAVRVYLMGRPPVTNLYSSAIFIGWGAGLFSAALERLFRNSLGIVAASIIGFSTLLLAQVLGAEGDTMAMLQAVLDTNFWLATHVVIITLGYASTFLAGLLAIIYIVRGALTTGLDREGARAMGQMVYGIVCFSILFSFVGTILGGLWADQSWGRFWGWDPKENGALLIVLWNAIVLHARWGGLVKQRGFMVLAVAGNIVTSWSWFGTNMLGVGLHSYGFMDAAKYWLASYCVLQLAFMAVGMLPLRAWRSGAALGANRPAPAPAA